MIQTIARLKVYGQRGTTYLNLFSQAMLLRLFLISQGITSWVIFSLVLSIASTAIIFLMFLEDKIGIFEAETEFNWSRAPQLKKITDTLDRVYEI